MVKGRLRPPSRRFIDLGVLLILGCAFLASCSGRGDVAVVLTPVRSTQTQIELPNPTATKIPTPIPSPTATEVCFETEGQLVRSEYSSYLMDVEIPIQIYLPPCYAVRLQDYPVLYVLHGYPLDETHWENLGVMAVFEEGFAQGAWGPFVIVMPFLPEDLNVHSDGGPGSYEEEFISGVIPFVESQYRVKRSASGRALAGVSRGGIWALEIGLRNGNMFHAMAVLSPALHVNRPRAAYDPFQLILSDAPFPEHIFLSVGEEEGQFRLKTEEFNRELVEYGIEHTFLLTTGAHVDSTWIGIMPEVLQFITESWR
jgi:enterochelin esterase-like enzyme